VLPIEVRDRLAGAELNYREVGATAGNLPAGYHQFTRSLPIGYGHEFFVAAGDAVRQWQVQLGAGLQVSASSPTATAAYLRSLAKIAVQLAGVTNGQSQRPLKVNQSAWSAIPPSHDLSDSQADDSGRRSPDYVVRSRRSTPAAV
jgi:uncharacterized protein (UPF0548 family)